MYVCLPHIVQRTKMNAYMFVVTTCSLMWLHSVHVQVHIHPFTFPTLHVHAHTLSLPQNDSEHCLLLALPCGRDAGDVRTQTHALKNSLISYLLQKQAAGIINVPNVPGSQVTSSSLHVVHT